MSAHGDLVRITQPVAIMLTVFIPERAQTAGLFTLVQ
jgi:hypothetical protein